MWSAFSKEDSDARSHCNPLQRHILNLYIAFAQIDIYIYIYIYKDIEREREKESERESERERERSRVYTPHENH